MDATKAESRINWLENELMDLSKRLSLLAGALGYSFSGSDTSFGGVQIHKCCDKCGR